MLATQYAVEVDGLTRRFGKVRAVDNLSFRVPKGSVFGFLGRNGAGKSTTLRILLGLLRADSGRIKIFGEDAARHRQAVLRKVGTVIERPSLYEHLDGLTNLEMARRVRSLPANETERVLELTGMRHAARRRVGTYSLGMKQRLAIARALLGEPELVILDEPTNGLDPEGIVQIRELLRSLPERAGATVILSSHLMHEVEQTAEHVAVIADGRLMLEGQTAALMNRSANLLLGADEPAKAASMLREKGIAFDEREGGLISIPLSGSSEERRGEAAQINRMAIAAGLSIHELHHEAESLEQIYFRATTQEERA